MNEAHRENLSALCDGELAFEQVRFMLRRSEHDADLRIAWSNYHLGRACLRREPAVLASSDFADRVMAALDAPAAGSAPSGRRWLRWSAGGAIAASVAVVALMVARPTAPDSALPGPARPAAAVQAGSQGLASTPIKAAPEVPRWLTPPSPAGQWTQPAAASVLDGHIRGDTLIPAAYSRRMAPYLSLRGYPVRTLSGARQYGRRVDGHWVIPMMMSPPAARTPPANTH